MLARFTGLVTADDPLWREALLEVEHDFYHLPGYAELCAERDGGKAAAFIQSGPDATVLLPLILLPVEGVDGGYCHATCPYGYPGITTNPGARAESVGLALGDALACLKRARIVTVFSRLHPLFDTPLAALEAHGVLIKHGETVSMDLAAAPEQSWSDIRATHRRHILAAQRCGYIAGMGWESVDEYLSCYQETMHRVAADEQYLFDRTYVEGIGRALGQHLHLCTVRVEGQVACGGLFSELGGIMQYHLGGTKDAYLRDSPMKLMFDFVRRWGHERGNRLLHLGGGVGGKADPLFHFKAGFSRLRHPFRTYRMIADEAMYRRLCSESGVSADRDGYFPPFARGAAGAWQRQRP